LIIKQRINRKSFTAWMAMCVWFGRGLKPRGKPGACAESRGLQPRDWKSANLLN